MKKIVILTNKETGESTPYPTVVELMRKHKSWDVGIGLPALFNALSKNKGRWENKKYIVEYKKVTRKVNNWD